MNRLQKKCLVAAAGTHLLVVVVVLCSGFVRPTPPVDTTPILTLIPTDATFAKAESGEREAQPPPPASTPPPTPVVTPPQQQQPDPPKVEVKPVVKPTEVTSPERTEPDDPTSDVPKPPPKKKREHEINADVSKPITRPVPKEDTSEADAAAERAAKRELRRLQEQKDAEIRKLLHNLNSGLSTATEVKLPGTSSASYANYGSIVISIYHRNWISPSRMNGDSAVVSFSVTIARDGSVISSHIDSRSGDASVDEAVQRMLDRVTFIHEFPDDSTERERTYHIDFNATRTTQ